MVEMRLKQTLIFFALLNFVPTASSSCDCEKLTCWLEDVDKKQIDYLKPKETSNAQPENETNLEYPGFDFTNITDENYENYDDITEEELNIDFSDIDLEPLYRKWHVNITSEAEKLLKENFECQCNKTMLRLLQLHAADGALYFKDRKKREELRSAIRTMTDNFLNAIKVPSKSCPDRPVLYRLSMPSKDCHKLKCIWETWMDEVGSKVKEPFQKMVDLSNESAKEHGYKDAGEAWRVMDVEDKNAEKLMKTLLRETMPLYVQLHAYVRRKLFQFYFDDDRKKCGMKPEENGLIPIHLTGHINGQEWKEVENIVLPYRKVRLPNVEKLLKEHNFTQIEMVKEAEKFFVSLGFRPMTKKFWENSIFVESENNDKSFGCHARAVDNLDNDDYRIYMCANLNLADWRTIHHEMGHIVAFMESENLPYKFRHDVNLVFGEGLGDSMVLSVSTIRHLEKVYNMKLDVKSTEKREIKLLMRSALYWIPMFSYAYLLDAFRYKVFEGKIKPGNYNKSWWKMRHRYQGLAPQSTRPDDKFDIGSILHTAINMPTAKYFLSIFVMFQMHEALCKTSGHSGPLHQCDIYGSKKAGEKLRSILQQGGSKSSVELLKELTGQNGYSSSSVLKYYDPLYKWLLRENKGHTVGWDNQINMNSGIYVELC